MIAMCFGLNIWFNAMTLPLICIGVYVVVFFPVGLRASSWSLFCGLWQCTNFKLVSERVSGSWPPRRSKLFELCHLMKATWSSSNLYDYIALELMFLDIGDSIMHEEGWIAVFYCKMLGTPYRFNLSRFNLNSDVHFRILCHHIQDLVYSAVEIHYQEGLRRIVQGLLNNDGLHILTYFEFFPKLNERFSRDDSDERNRFYMFCDTVIDVGIEPTV